jgi:hypothetical protein
MITVWYRAQKRDPREFPMKELLYNIIDADGNGKGWGLINDEPKKAGYASKKILGVVCSPAAKNTRCNMVIFYVEDLRAMRVQFITDFDDKITEGEQEGENMIGPLNQRFMPHELVSISIYEEDHPNNDDGLSTSITHYSPPSNDEDPCMPDLIKDRMNNKDTIVNPNYRYKLIEKRPTSAAANREALWLDVH